MNNIDISPIKRLSKTHVEKTGVEFDDLSEYITLAQKLIVSCANRIRFGLANEILNNEDVVANMATELMSAELSFNGLGNIYGYRKQIANWVIFEYIGRRAKPSNINTISIDTENNNSVSYKNILPSKIDTPETISIQNESENNFEFGIDQMIDQGYISETQADYLKMHYLGGISMTEIGKQRGVGRAAVSAVIMRAVKRLRKQTGWLETTTFSGYN